MNERIKELAELAGLKVNADGEIGPAYFGSVDAGYRKLAELIAKECMNIIVQNRNYAKEHHWPASETANVCLYEIEQTFGVSDEVSKLS